VTDFLDEFTLTATQVRIKARSSCITASRSSKGNFLPLAFPSLFTLSPLYIAFYPLSTSTFFSLSSIIIFFLFFFLSLHVSRRTRFRVVRACIPVSQTHEMYIQKPHIKRKQYYT